MNDYTRTQLFAFFSFYVMAYVKNRCNNILLLSATISSSPEKTDATILA